MNTISEEEWKKKLTPEEYRVMREKGTEAPFTGKYVNTKEKGIFRCKACGNELFSSETKFDSGTGWPSFTDPVNREHIEFKEDRNHGMARTEVLCKRCGAHLGHVFDDLPETYHAQTNRVGAPSEAGGKRYCINSICLDLEEKKTE